MVTSPAACMRSMSWTIADLIGVMNNLGQIQTHDIQKRTFPRPRIKINNLLVQAPVSDWRSVRFP